MLGKKDKKALDEKILNEIRQKVISKSMQDQEHKDRMEDEKANLQALEEISGLTKKEISKIAEETRQKYSKSTSGSLSKKPILIGVLAALFLIAGGYFIASNKEQKVPVIEPTIIKKVTVTTQTIQNAQPAKTTPIKKSPSKDDLAFLKAAKSGNREMVSHFLDNGVDINVQERFGKTALMLATESGQLSTVKFLLDKGADLQLRSKGSNKQDLYTAADIAKLKKNSRITKILNDKLIENRPNESNIKKLWDLEVAYCNVCFTDAVLQNNIEAVKLFLKTDVDLNIQSKSSRSGTRYALEFAAEEGHVEVTRLILSSGKQLSNRHVEMAVSFAANFSQPEIVKLLAKKGAILEYADQSKLTPLFRGLKSTEVMKVLLDHGAEVNALGPNGRTPLMELTFKYGKNSSDSSKWMRERIELLLKHGADPNLYDNSGKSALDYLNKRSDKYFRAVKDVLIKASAGK